MAFLITEMMHIFRAAVYYTLSIGPLLLLPRTVYLAHGNPIRLFIYAHDQSLGIPNR